MTALSATRDELEVALRGDENWRALRTGGGADADPHRRERDARLMKALEANPLYVAWTNVCQAIEALQAAVASKAAQAELAAKGATGGKPAIPTLEAAVAAGKAAARPRAGVDAKREDDPAPLRIADPAEAKVSFVRREAPAATAKASADTAAQPKAADGDFVPNADAVGEAEVAIVNAPVRRFLKALSGD